MANLAEGFIAQPNSNQRFNMKKPRIFDKISKNAEAIQAIAGFLTFLVALGALIGIKFQLDGARILAQEQSARDIYREFLSLSIAQPQFSKPDYCAIVGTPQETAYENYVDYMLYTAEQNIDADLDWKPVFTEVFANHNQYLCSVDIAANLSDETKYFIKEYKARTCAAIKPCPNN